MALIIFNILSCVDPGLCSHPHHIIYHEFSADECIGFFDVVEQNGLVGAGMVIHIEVNHSFLSFYEC